MYNWYYPYWGSLPVDIAGMSKKKLAQLNGNLEFLNFFEYFFNRLMAMPQWEGFPDTMDMTFFTRCLILAGKALAADVDGAKIALYGANGAGLTVNGYPTQGWGYGRNGFNRQFKLFVPGADEASALRKGADGSNYSANFNAIMCWADVDQFPPINYVMMAAKRAAHLFGAIDVAIDNLKMPLIVACSESDVNSIQEALKQRESNVAAIIASKGLQLENLKVWDTKANPEVLKSFWEQLNDIQSWFDNLFGIKNNPNQDKKERLLVSEVNANNESILNGVHMWEAQLQLFCERFNEWTGLNTSVTWGFRDEAREEELEYVDQSQNGRFDDTEGTDDRD